MKVYKNGVLVADSMAMSGSTVKPNTNYEIISIPEETLQQYGAGYYTVEVSMRGTNKGPENNRIGIAWEQVR